MSTVPATAAPSKLTLILAIIQAGLAGLSVVPIAGPFAELGAVFLGIFQNGTALYQAETGQPFDITKIPFEQPVP